MGSARIVSGAFCFCGRSRVRPHVRMAGGGNKARLIARVGPRGRLDQILQVFADRRRGWGAGLAPDQDVAIGQPLGGLVILKIVHQPAQVVKNGGQRVQPPAQLVPDRIHMRLDFVEEIVQQRLRAAFEQGTEAVFARRGIGGRGPLCAGRFIEKNLCRRCKRGKQENREQGMSHEGSFHNGRSELATNPPAPRRVPLGGPVQAGLTAR